MAWCKQQQAIDWANVDRNYTSHKNTLIIDRIYQNNKRTFVGFHPNYTTNFNAKYSSFTSLTARPDNFDSSNFPLVGRENRCVWVSKWVYSVNSKRQQQQTYAQNTYRLWTHRDLIEALGPSFQNIVGRGKKWHAIVRSRTVTWLTRWRLPQWSQLNSGIFFPTNPMRKHATMLDGTNTPAPNWSVISYIQQREPTVKHSGTENKVIRESTRSRPSIIGWKQIQGSTHDVPTKYKYT